MDRKQYFEELHIALTREGFASQPEQDELLPVEWDGLPLCRITADGGVRYPTTPRPKSSVSRRNGTIRRSNLISKRHLARLLMLISERSMP